MDKRTLLFALVAFSSVFAVNTYFKWQHDEKVQQWNIDQKANKTEKLHQLELKIADDTATREELPLTTIYSDATSDSPLREAIFDKNALYTTSWIDTPPTTVYAKVEGSNSREKFTLTQEASKAGKLLIYQSEAKKPLLIGNLPDVGNENLQLIFFGNNPNQEAPTIQLAEYKDGIFTLTSDKFNFLKKELDSSFKPTPPHITSGLVLLKSRERYLPVGIYDGDKKHFTALEDLVGLSSKVAENHKKSQEYYVLENDYQQLVITNVGGALAEINLPFESKTNISSVVKPIQFDYDMKKDHPYNDYFPAHTYFTAGEKSEGPFAAHQEGSIGGYYPLIRRDLIETGHWKSVNLNPRYYAFNLISDQPEVSELVYTVTHFDATSIILEAEQKKRKITKTYKLPTDKDAPYTFELTIKIDGDRRGLWLSSGVPEVELFSGSPDPVLKYRITRNNKPAVEIIPLPKETATDTSIHPDWLANSNGFFGLIMDPIDSVTEGFRAAYVPGQSVPSRLTEVNQDYDRFTADSLPGYLLMLPIKQDQKVLKLRVFAGPFSDRVLRTVDKTFTKPETGSNPDYMATQSYHGFFSFISEPFAKFLFILMNFFHSITHSWAFSIILLTVALRILMYPLNAWSTKSMLKMQQIAPEVTAIQERNKKDPKKAQLEVMNLYREKGVNPISGCFPLLLQMPFLIGMFDLLKTTFELRGASFIPGWINDLAAPDVLFSWDRPLFFIGNSFHLLPFFLGGVMYLQQRMSMPALDLNEMTDQQRQQRAMTSMMPIIFTFMFYHFPSGLNIYWLSSMSLGILQQWWTQRKLAQTPPSKLEVLPKQNKKKL